MADDDLIAAMQQRIDDIMLGKANLKYDKMLMQEDAGDDDYGKLKPQSNGHKGAHLDYRKIQQLEFDRKFLTYMQLPIFREACQHVYCFQTPIAAFRAMFMNKPAHKGSVLPWHQDAWTFLDRPPNLTAWTALDPAKMDNGCIQIIPRSHKLGRINPDHNSGFLTDEQAETYCRQEDLLHLEMEAGEVALLHNWTLHRSDRNSTDKPRRAFSVCYMDAETKHIHDSETYTTIFGPGALSIEQLEAENG